jgi:ParB family transcriptional regulator, chromosome partitioning protein
LPVGKGSIARATNASNGNTKVKDKTINDKLVQEMPNILTDIMVTQITEVPASWKKKAVNIPKLEDLMKSIQSFGVLEPIILRRLGDNQFQLLSGHNRLQAVVELGLETITSRVFDGISDTQAKIIYQDLHKKEEALIEKEKKLESMKQDNQIENNQVEDYQKRSNLIKDGQQENIHELKFKVVTTLSRDMPDYLL